MKTQQRYRTHTTAGRTTRTALTALVATMALTTAAGSARATCGSPPGDINQDGKTTVADAQCGIVLTLWSLNGADPAALPVCAEKGPASGDLTCDSAIDITDVLLSISLILTVPLSATVDANGNNCSDTCDAEACGDGVCDANEGCGVCLTDCDCPPAGNCCVARQESGCEVSVCQSCVCAADNFCCEGLWDAGCVALAQGSCLGSCACVEAEDASCCGTSDTPGCGDSPCESCVCGAKPLCCSLAWDKSCTEVASSPVCASDCSCPISANPNDCCTPHLARGCMDMGCSACVCAADAWCCEVQWDESCLAVAASACDPDCSCSSPE